MALKLGSNLDMAKVKQGLGNKYKLVPHLDRAISKGEFEWEFSFKPKTSDDAWHPSGDCTPSLHDLYLKATGRLEERLITPTMLKIFMNGHMWHAYLQQIVQRLGFAEADAIERKGVKSWASKPYHWATGSGDIAPCIIPHHGTFIVDFKTVNSRMYTSGIPADYLAKWECQGNIYMDFFECSRILFVGIQKDSPHDMCEWEFHYNEELVNTIYKKWKLVSECLEEEIEPPEDEEVLLPLKGPAQ